MSWTFIGMLLLVVGLIAANLALLKHGSKKNQRPLKPGKPQSSSQQQQQKAQAAATTAPVVVQNSEKTTPDQDATASQNSTQDNDQSQV
ncbi:hypothetical protein [Rheinheimera sp.]|uniref:hypothetical protein n=1 Tax=Rheinheimera sp. TaxID=1869214 RepID=UPI0027B884F2|nr:hypothetical protein [Rheinheimera sp.]